jgi:hypothetical protein
MSSASGGLVEGAFEVDHVDVDQKEGWYVEIERVGQSITHTVDQESVRRRSLPSIQ